MLQSAGLAQALAYWMSKTKKEPAFGRLLEDLRQAPEIEVLIPAKASEELVKGVAALDTAKYIRATRLVQQQIVFLKRMVEAYHEPKEVTE